ncbi:MAG: NUDIX hydrolase [Actinobacteria bacterium]|nr:MAG: NUDIX hydrolase [Actinomycetota bacterium]RIK04788.1 MAG: NUDIX hydrolase [Acidobacteriota bacterium]
MERLDVGDPESVPVRDAATVMLVRDAAEGIEVCMLRRHLQSGFVGGAYVFPGGAVDAGDHSSGINEVSRISPEAGRPAGAASVIAFEVAAIREAFEEAGILLAYDRGGELVTFEDQEVDERFSDHRGALHRGERGLEEICRGESLTLAVDRLRYVSRWVTPLGSPRRFDTRFFVAAAPPGQEPLHDDIEVIENLWIVPEEALARHGSGRMPMILPTVRSLEFLGGFGSVDELLTTAADIEVVEPVRPRVEGHRDGERIVLPDGEAFDAETSRPTGQDWSSGGNVGHAP